MKRLLSWFKSLERPYFIFMPRELRLIQARVEAGEDPDDVAGIEKLWLWRFNKRSDAFARRHRDFYNWCMVHHPEDFKPPVKAAALGE